MPTASRGRTNQTHTPATREVTNLNTTSKDTTRIQSMVKATASRGRPPLSPIRCEVTGSRKRWSGPQVGRLQPTHSATLLSVCGITGW
ncbi:hypothetical protein AMECASPLE_034843, partial [Ameca splendens]